LVSPVSTARDKRLELPDDLPRAQGTDVAGEAVSGGNELGNEHPGHDAIV
jgi:hypothetical protein